MNKRRSKRTLSFKNLKTENHGVIIGMSQTNSPITYDPFTKSQGSNFNATYFGTPGAGMSYRIELSMSKVKEG